MSTESPPTDGDGARPDESERRPTDHQQVATETTTESVPRQLAGRREASRRLPRLAHCGVDPWTADHRGWQDQHDVAMARCGWAEPWQRQRAVEAWERGVR
jgi:hypothetical protein